MVCLLTCTAQAQVTRTDADGKPAASGYLESLEAVRPGTHLIFKDRLTGRVQQLPEVNAEWLNAFRERAELQNQSRLFDLQNLAIDGTTRGEFVELQVEAQIRIRVPDEWVRVPLEFGDFQLIEPAPEHSVLAPSTGDERFEEARLPQKSWQFKGEGVHRLKFHLIGKIFTDANGRQKIRLTAPIANQSRLLLKLPGIVPTAELSTGRPMDVRADGILGISEIETWGLSKETEITWAPETQNNDQPIALQATVPAQMRLDLTTEPASLTVQQTVSISGGSLDTVKVQLPPGIANAEITSMDLNGAPVVRSFDVSDNGMADIEFVAPMTGTIVLNYGLELTKNAKDVSIRFPVIKDAVNQTAELELVVPIGLEVDFSIPDDGSVRQKRVEPNSEPNSETRTEGVRQAAYRLLSENAELKLSIKDPEAFYSVVPLVNFETEGDSVLLTARFTVNVVRGAFNEMTIVWPEYEADGWQILDGYTRLITGSDPPVNLAPPSDGDNVTVQFPKRQSREFVIEIQALRDLASFQESGLLHLPNILTPTPHITTVSLIESDTYSMVLSAKDAKTTFPQLPLSRWPEILTEREEPLTVWLVDAPDQAVHLDVQKQQSEIRTSVQAEVSVVNDTIHFSETLTYRVRHRDVREVRLLVGSKSPSVRLRGFDEELQPLMTQDNVVTYSLPEAMRGEFDLLVDLYWSADSVSKTGLQIELPLVLPASSDETIESIQVATRMPESITLLQSEDWERVHSDSFPAAWRTNSIPDSVPMLLKHSLQSESAGKPHLLVLKSALIGNNLMTATTAVFSETPEVVAFSVPSGATVFRARLQGEAAEFDIVADDSTNQIVQIRPQGNSAGLASTATLVVQQDIRGKSRLFGQVTPLLASPIAAGPDCNCLWVLRQASDTSVFHWGGSVSEITPAVSFLAKPGQSQEKVSALVDILAPIGDSSRADVMRLLDDCLIDSDQYQLLVGPATGQPQTLIVISRRTQLLATAIISLLMYFAMTRLHSMALTTIAVLAAGAVTTVFAFIPGPAHLILIRFIPGCVIAIIAGALQRWFSGKSASSLKSVGTSDGSTIFTIDQPQPTHAAHNSV